MDGAGPVSAPAADRAAELTAMLTDPRSARSSRRGRLLAIDLLPLLDLAAIGPAGRRGSSATPTPARCMSR